MLSDRGERPRWADLQDTPPSQEPHTLLAAPEELRVSQPSQETVAPTQDLDGSRETLRVQLEIAANLGVASSATSSGAAGCGQQGEGTGDALMSSSPGDHGGSTIAPAASAAVTVALPDTAAVSPPRQLSLQALLTTACSRAPSGLSVSMPPRLPAHRRKNHRKEEQDCRPRAPPPTCNKRPRNDAQTSMRKGSRANRPGVDTATPTRKGAWAQQSPAREAREVATPTRAAAKTRSGISVEELDRRREHRHSGVEAVKKSPEYQALQKIRPRDAPVVAPQTPDPNDLAVSKRSWEKKMMEWRVAVRQGCSDHREEPIEDF